MPEIQRKVVANLKALCPKCQVALVVEEPGSDTTRWVRCQTCSDYIYWVGPLVFEGSGVIVRASSPEAMAEVRAALAGTTLLPWVMEHINATRRKLGLPVEGEEHA